ncbi:hypothetical protein C4K35_1992 [Pseudomonas chlororaphis subsp. piscium]|nr:hypothetical protein C4K35_1992 [Pseudomonas chlororaphis subsp. piscium]AZC62426.1 hypothetical protein C4K33_1924 [Pseudomonas chlororaphis subsp. piscium]
MAGDCFAVDRSLRQRLQGTTHELNGSFAASRQSIFRFVL